MTLGRTGSAGAKPAPRRVRDLLIAQGLAATDLLASPRPRHPRLAEPDLEPASFLPEFAPLVHKLQALLGGGRALSVLVAGARDAGLLRTHAALQIALGIAPTGRSVALVDADFLRPGLGGLLSDPTAEGLTDVVRFGRTVTSLLHQPVPEGPWLLPAGSFPEENPLPLQGDDLRSALFRVAQRCDLAVYVAPMVVGDALHPLFGVCDQAIVVGEEDGASESAALVDAVRELRARGARLAGVVAYEAPSARDFETAPRFEPGFLYSPDLPLPEPPAAAEPARPAGTPSASLPPAPEWPLPAPAPSDWESEPAPPRARPVFEPPEVVLPSEPRAEPAAARGPEELAVPPPEPIPLGPVPPPLPVFEVPSEDEAERRDYGAPVATRRTSEEAGDTARSVDLSRGEFAFEEESPPSRWPLFLVVAMLVMIAGFVSWAIWDRHAKRAAEQALTQAGEPSRAATPAAPQGPAETPVAAGEAPRPGATPPQAGVAGGEAGGVTEVHVPGAPVAPPTAATGLDDRAAARGASEVPPGVAPAPGPGTAGGTSSGETRAPGPGTTGSTPPATPAATPPAPAAAPRGAAGDELFTVWVASYQTERRAQAELRSLRQRGYPGGGTQRMDLGAEKGIWYRVYAGSFATAAEAEAARARLMLLPDYREFTMVRRLPRD